MDLRCGLRWTMLLVMSVPSRKVFVATIHPKIERLVTARGSLRGLQHALPHPQKGLQVVVGANNFTFPNCSSTIQCGSLQNIGYPFWGMNRENSCGKGTEYELACVNDTTLKMTLSGLTYRVLDFNNSNRSLTVARDDYYNNICPQYFYNVSSISPFSYSDTTLPTNLTLYYSCSAQELQRCTTTVSPNNNSKSTTTCSRVSERASNQFTCTNYNGNSTTGYFVTMMASDIPVEDQVSSLGSCANSVVLPVSRTALQAIQSTPTKATVASALQEGFGLVWSDDSGACQGCIQSGGWCGNDSKCYCSDQSYSSACGLSPLPSPLGGPKSRLSVLLPALLTPLVLAVIASIFLEIRRHNLRHHSPTTSQIGENNFDVENFINGIAPRKYTYSELKRMSNSFSIKLGQGGYGSVYKGSLKDGRPVAVKILNVSKESSGEDFFNEVASISRTAHVNVVALLGFCYERKRRALVYEFMPNGSLDKFISTKGSSDRSSTLECKVLYQITLGIARGLEYLHRGCNTRIVHFDIKPHNILLDEDLVPKISDFGLAKLWQGKESMVSMQGTRGTIGYIAPEVFCRNFGGVSHKSDVYSYGMLVLDMVCGRYNFDARVSHTSDAYFPDWIYREYLQLGKDITLNEITTEEEEEITRKMIIVGLWCIQNRPSDRPSIKEVIEMLEGSTQALQVPLLKPLQASPARFPELYSTTSSSSFN